MIFNLLRDLLKKWIKRCLLYWMYSLIIIFDGVEVVKIIFINFIESQKNVKVNRDECFEILCYDEKGMLNIFSKVNKFYFLVLRF